MKINDKAIKNLKKSIDNFETEWEVIESCIKCNDNKMAWQGGKYCLCKKCKGTKEIRRKATLEEVINNPVTIDLIEGRITGNVKKENEK